MDKNKKAKLEKAGWVVGDYATFLGLSEKEKASIEAYIHALKYLERNKIVSKPNLKNIDPYYGCHWYDNGMWFYAHVDHTGKWYVSISSPESGNFAESGYYKGTGLTTDNEGTILKVGDEVAVIVKVGKAASIRRGKITKLSKSYAFIDVENWSFQTKFAPQSILKIASREPKEKLSVEDSHWYCNDFHKCETFDCINCTHKEKIENE